MGAIGSHSIASQVTVNGVSSPTNAHLAMPVATTEYSFVFPQTAKRICILNDGSSIVEYSYVSAGTANPIRPGEYIKLDNLSLAGTLTIYFKSVSASQIVKFDYWS